MFVSTREMLGQTSTNRAAAEAVVREHYGPECNVEKALQELSISAALNNLGLGALSDEALYKIVSLLKEQKRAS